MDKTIQFFPDKVEVNQELGKSNSEKIHHDYKQFWLNSRLYEGVNYPYGFFFYGIILLRVDRETLYWELLISSGRNVKILRIFSILILTGTIQVKHKRYQKWLMHTIT